MRLVSGLLMILMAGTGLSAESVYVSDQLVALIRSGPSRDQAVIATVPAGAPVSVLEVNKAAGFTRIQTKNGQQGWMVSDQLSPTPSARDQIAAIQAQMEQMRQNHAQELDELRVGVGQALKQENEQLRVRATELEKRVEVLDQQNRVLQDRSRQEFMVYGGGIAFVGLLLGILLPRLRSSRQRDRWY